jgi:LacI family transcriptional regulator
MQARSIGLLFPGPAAGGIFALGTMLWQRVSAAVARRGEKPPGSRRMANRAISRYHSAMVTLGDVARRAGVSAASVSRVLNHPTQVSAAVRARVTAAMDELGYVRDGAARALASRHSFTIGTVVPALGIGIFAAGVEALQRRLEAHGYQLLIAASDYDEAKEARQVRALIEHGVDGIALVGHRHAPVVYELLRARKLPYVNAYEFDGANPHPSIGIDNRGGAAALIRHLIGLGHRDVAIITAPPSLNDRIAARLGGMIDGLAAHGIAVPPQRREEVAQTIEAGRIATRALLSRNPELTAICCTTDTLAIGALSECRTLGVAIPAEVSVTGFSDLTIVAQIDPPLSTVHIPADRIGIAIADFLLDRIAGRAGPSKIELAAEIVIRGSSGPVRTAVSSRPRFRLKKVEVPRWP